MRDNSSASLFCAIEGGFEGYAEGVLVPSGQVF
jgi:hypothetical protein